MAKTRLLSGLGAGFYPLQGGGSALIRAEAQDANYFLSSEDIALFFC